MTKSQSLYIHIKRVIDFLGSIIGILVCFVLFWWWILIVNTIVTKGQPIFSHERVGKDGKMFKLLKFRSMKPGVDKNLTSKEAKNKELTTGFGRFLRKTSLDETIQLLNIFAGQMAFIGPRPLIDKGEDHITIEERKINGSILLKPGISGYAQINGRTNISGKEKGDLDGYYFKHMSFWLDLKIFILSIFKFRAK